MSALARRLHAGLLVVLLVAACAGGTASANVPKELTLPSACSSLGAGESGPDGLVTWTIRCEDKEHLFTEEESRPLLARALADGGWVLCGAAAGTGYYRKGERITTLAFLSNDRRDADFGKVRIGQKQRTVECP